MSILHVITGMRKAAGTSVFVGELAGEQARRGHQVSIVHREIWRKDNYTLDSKVDFVGEPDFWASIGERSYDIVHIHGLWEPMLHRFARYARRCGKKIVWSPHGGLTKWALGNHWWKKLPIWFLYQKRDLKLSAAIHVTAQSEVEDVRRLGFKNRIIVAPLGVTIDDNCVKVRGKLGRGAYNAIYKQNSKKEALGDASSCMGEDCEMKSFSFIGRVHPVKNLPTLIRAFGSVRKSDFQLANQWHLRIVGPDQEGHTAELKVLANELGIADLVEFVGPKYDDELKREYVNADCFVLPSHSENFGSVVIESLSVGVPVITTKGTPWQELEEYGCGKWVDVNEQAIGKALVEMMTKTDEERAEMGRRGIELVRSRYSWGAVCDKIIKGYEEILND